MRDDTAVMKCLEVEWHDHLHMRDQTWKSLNYSMVFFGGLVAAWQKLDPIVVVVVAAAVTLITFLGFRLAMHHRECQTLKLRAIKNLEGHLDLLDLLAPVLKEGRAMASKYIAYMHLAMCGASIGVLVMAIVRLVK